MRFLLRKILIAPFAFLAFFLCLIIPKRRKELIWGPVPIINNKYWSAAMQKIGYRSKTLMYGFFASINKKEDFDIYFDDLTPRYIRPKKFRELLKPFFGLIYIIRNVSSILIRSSP